MRVRCALCEGVCPKCGGVVGEAAGRIGWVLCSLCHETFLHPADVHEGERKAAP
jgi:hypothetical protein